MPKVELSDRFCRTMKADKGTQTDYFDTIVNGLCLRVSPAGTKSWNLVYTKPIDGKRARMKLGRYPEISLAAAREKAREARGQIGEGTDPIAEKRAKANSQSVADLVENYIARHASTKRSGDEIARRLRKNVSDVIGTIKLTDFHRRDITRCIDAVKDRGAHVEANRLFEDIRAMVRWARGRGDLDQNIVEGMRRPSETTARDRVLTAGEIKTMWRELTNSDMRESTRRIIRLCLITGQRVGEVSGMTRGELDLTNGRWTIPVERSKNKRSHEVPLSPPAVETIADQIADVEWLAKRKLRAVPSFIFPGPGARAPVTAGSIPKAVKRLQTDGMTLGTDPWTPHDLRRTVATHMEEIGISPFIIGHVLNHASVTTATITSRVYARYDYAKEKREALNLWAKRLASIVDGRSADIIQIGAAE